MKVLLVRPHLLLELSRRFHAFLHLEPLELEVVAGGVLPPHEVEILDLSHGKKPFQTIRGKLRAMRPDVVGFGCYSNQARAVRELAAIVRELLPETKIIVGGVHASIAPKDLNEPALFDYVIRGEGSVAMRRLLPVLAAGGTLADEGILPVGQPSFEALSDGLPPAHPDYAEVAMPRRDLVDRSKYFCIWSGKRNEKMPTLFPRLTADQRGVPSPMQFLRRSLFGARAVYSTRPGGGRQ